MKNLALLLIAASAVLPLHAAVVGHWRFEGDPFLADSGPNALTLANPAGAPNVTQVALPGTGAGSAYPAMVLGSPNGSAARFDGTNDRLTSPDNALFEDTTFTVEAFVTLTADNASTKTIAGHWNADGNQRGWLFGISGGEVPVLLTSPNGTNTVTTSSGLPALALNTDYYVSVTVDMADTSAGGMTFYIMDLTNGGVLQSTGAAHADLSFFDSSTSFAIGATAQATSTWTGLIDEVRISDSKLSVDQLMVVPEPGSLGLMVFAAGLAGCRRRR